MECDYPELSLQKRTMIESVVIIVSDYNYPGDQTGRSESQWRETDTDKRARVVSMFSPRVREAVWASRLLFVHQTASSTRGENIVTLCACRSLNVDRH